MRLTQFSDYSLRLLLFLAENPHRVCAVREIAAWYGISRDHLVKVAHNLAKLGFVSGTQGRGGGLRLARPASEITLAAVVRATEPDFHMVECFDPDTNTCRISRACGIRHVLHDATRAFFKSLDGRTLASIAVPRNPIPAQQKESRYEPARQNPL
jgi:Rrf2 family nitric oxide-sensitive transcriptional repressor